MEIGCGTGYVTAILSEKGYEVIGIDSSREMISKAKEKYGYKIQFLVQDGRLMKLHGNFDACLAIYDVFNYILYDSELEKVFRKIYRLLNKDGILIFDVNAEYYLLYCFQKDTYLTGASYKCYGTYDVLSKDPVIVDFTFKFYGGTGKRYYKELHRKRGYSKNTLGTLLNSTGFEVLDIYDGFSFDAPKESTKQYVVVARKRNWNVENVIIGLLERNRIDYSLIEHENVYTCEHEARIFKCSIDFCAKSMLIKLSNDDYVLAIVPGDQRVNIRKIARLENVKKGRLAKPEEVADILGSDVGCVPPFGHKQKVKTYLDKSLLEKDFILFNPGTHSKTIKVNGEELKEIIEAIFYSNDEKYRRRTSGDSI